MSGEGELPTLAQYRLFARDKGRHSHTGINRNNHKPFTVFEDSNGNDFIFPGPETQRLDPLSIAHLDRKLNIDSPFPKAIDVTKTDDNNCVVHVMGPVKAE